MKKIAYLFFLLMVLLGTECKKETTNNYDWKDISINTNLPITCIQMLDEKVGYVGGGYGIDKYPKETQEQYYVPPVDTSFKDSTILAVLLYRTKNGGKNWETIKTPFKTAIKQIYFTNIDTGYVWTVVDGVYKTNDAGKTWKNVLKCKWNENVFTSYTLAFNGNIGYAVYYDSNYGSLIYRTTDGGETWTDTTTQTKENIFFSKKTACFYKYSDENLYQSNSDNTWKKIATFSNGIGGVFFLNPSHFFVTASQLEGNHLTPNLYETTDAANTWHKLYSLPLLPRTIAVDNNAQAISLWGKDFYSITFKQNKTEKKIMTTERNEFISATDFPSSSVGYAVGANGMILKYTK